MKLAQLLRHIEKTTGASVSVHILHPAFLDDENLQLTPDQTIHHGPFCREMKLNGNFPQCHSNKQKCISIARANKSFAGECPFGLWEMVVPFFFHDELSAIIFMGHLRQRDSRTPEQKNIKDISIPILTDKVKEDLQEYARFLKDFLRIEIELWLFSGGMSGKKRNENYYIANTQRFIESNFMKNISLAELSETLRVNPNYLGELLKKSFGKTFRQMLAEKRVHESMLYLKLHDNMNISQIAAACGFEDSNYFSQVFRKITGLTPSGYQKSVITKNDL